MENIATDPLPPLPEQSHLRQASSGIEQMELRSGLISSPSNSWRILPEEIPVNSEKARPVQTTLEARIGSSCVRSPFRRGKMLLDAEGFTLQGTGIKAIPWLQLACGVGTTCSLIFLFAASVSPLPPTIQQPLSIFFFACFYISLIALFTQSWINEQFRTPMEIRVSWSQVKEMQSSFRMTWTVLIYSESAINPKDTEKFSVLPISSLSPAVLEALQNAVEAYAPGRLRRAIDKEVWTTGKLFGVAILLIIIAVAGIVVFQNMNN